MAMALSARETEQLIAVMQALTHAYDSSEVRHNVGERLLSLFDADFYASYVWNTQTQLFESRVSINMDPDNLTNYENYYQYHDPITPKLQQRLRATAVAEIMPQEELIKTEFFNDFLSLDGLYYGMNFYAYDGARNIGDIRIWRRASKEIFQRRDLELMNAIGPSYTNALRTVGKIQDRPVSPDLEDAIPSTGQLMRQFDLTEREAEIALLAAAGLSDLDISLKAGIAPTTVRTHMRHLFEKLGVTSRTALAARILIN